MARRSKLFFFSRPDLIDVALLRPGRLDKSVFCDFPDENQRFDILTKLTSKYEHISPEILGSIAEKTENFTGNCFFFCFV